MYRRHENNTLHSSHSTGAPLTCVLKEKLVLKSLAASTLALPLHFLSLAVEPVTGAAELRGRQLLSAVLQAVQTQVSRARSATEC